MAPAAAADERPPSSQEEYASEFGSSAGGHARTRDRCQSMTGKYVPPLRWCPARIKPILRPIAASISEQAHECDLHSDPRARADWDTA